MQIEPDNTATRGQYHALLVVVPRFNMATLITMIEVMRIANYLTSQQIFSWQICSFDGTPVRGSNGMQIAALGDPDALPPADFIFVNGSWGTEHYTGRPLIAWLRKRARQGARICAVELGCYIVARAGLLEGRQATTHWSWMPGFAEKFDRIEVSEQLFTQGGRVMTCAGGMAGVDMMLALAEELLGAEMAGEIADQMIHAGPRPPDAPQRRTMGHATQNMPPVLGRAIAMIERHIEDPLSVPDLAAELGVSQRQLERLFKRHIGCTVVQFGLLMRLQHARVLLIATDMGVREIATASGFNTLAHFAHAFGRCFGRRPSEYRDSWPAGDAVPTWPGTLSAFLAELRNKAG